MPRRKYPIFHENDLITEGVMWVDIPDFEDKRSFCKKLYIQMLQ